ncbi:MAG TPA: GyrI-like domain-containing protein [Hymenobacter sp.]|jgi:AraC family transcriptional regulator
MTPRIEVLGEKELVGMRMAMSLADNKTGALWQAFMSNRKAITNCLTNDLISLQVYQPTHFADFKPTNEFEKWATVEVASFDDVPTGMETFTLAGGLYAVFDYKGSSNDPRIFQYIFGTWLPTSGYVLDNRPHFEVLGAAYKNNDPSSEEEIWIPIKQK